MSIGSSRKSHSQSDAAEPGSTGCGSTPAERPVPSPAEAVRAVDRERIVGTWHEVVRSSRGFREGGSGIRAHDASAHDAAREDGEPRGFEPAGREITAQPDAPDA